MIKIEKDKLYLITGGSGFLGVPLCERVLNLGGKVRVLARDEGKLVELKQKKLEISPDDNGEFEFRLPNKGLLVKFRFTTGKDESNIDTIDEDRQKRYGSDVSERVMIKLEQQVTEIEGERDPLKISNILKRLPILDARHLRKYIKENEPGMDLSVKAKTPGGGSVDTFLRFTRDFFWPEL